MEKQNKERRMYMPKTLNELVLKYLTDNGIKQSFLADSIGEDRSLISRWLKGTCNVNANTIAKIHDFLQGSYKSVEQLLKDE